MNEKNIKIKRALISVSDKTGILEFARSLYKMQIEIISTGGTAKYLIDNGIPTVAIETITGFPEIFAGRVKTLHPLIHGAILGLRDEHQEIAARHNIEWIDLVVVNLYPFALTTKKENIKLDEIYENIDIGGPTLIRAAAKNLGWAAVAVDPIDYEKITYELNNKNSISYKTRCSLSAKAFIHTANYDALIANYFTKEYKNINLVKQYNLRYGENPHQAASVWQQGSKQTGLLAGELVQGKPLSYNNLVDADAAFTCAKSFVDPACVIVKHATPCGVAVGDNAFGRALACDSMSAFGGIIAFNRECSGCDAENIIANFMEVVIAPSFSLAAIKIFERKPKLRILQVNFSEAYQKEQIKQITGGFLMQTPDKFMPIEDDLRCVTEKKPSNNELQQLLFAFSSVKFVKSNAIVLVNDMATVGIAGGHVSRVDAVEFAVQKAGQLAKDSVAASDAFFPFADSIKLFADAGVTAIIQPGGSIRDKEVIAACNNYNLAMVFTGRRCFRH